MNKRLFWRNERFGDEGGQWLLHRNICMYREIHDEVEGINETLMLTPFAKEALRTLHLARGNILEFATWMNRRRG